MHYGGAKESGMGRQGLLFANEDTTETMNLVSYSRRAPVRSCHARVLRSAIGSRGLA